MKNLTRNIFTGVGLEVEATTTGYDGGDGSVTTIALRPQLGFQNSGGALCHGGPHVYEDIYQLSFTARGDMELNGLRQALQAATEMLDEMLDPL